MADLRISDLPEMLAGQLNAGDPIAIADTSASTTKRISAGALVADGIAGLPDGSIPGSKVDISVQPESVGTAELKDGSVTGPKLAANSGAGIGASLPVSGDYVGQLFLVTAGEPQLFSWDGANWVAASGTIDVVGDTTGLVNTYSVTAGGITTVSADIDNTTGANQFLAGPVSGSGVVTSRQIDNTDMPTAGVQRGAVAVNGNGLAMSGDTITLSKGPATSAASHLVTYDSEGLVVGGAPIGPADLPISGDGSLGAVQPGEGIAVDGTGTISIDNSVAASTHTKISYSGTGLVTGGTSLVESDIPDLGTSKITSGVFGGNFIDEKAITMGKLADLSTAYIQEAQPNVTNPQNFIGAFWYQESTAQMRIFNGLSWRAVGFGNLSAQNLRWGGLVDASTGLMVGVTEVGSTAGLVIGQGLPAAADELGGLYVMAQVAGSSIGVTPGVSYLAGNWCLCINESEGWVKIDNVGGGGGGGGGASSLNDLLDVSIAGASDGDWLQLQSTGQWTNVADIDGGTF